MYCTSAQYSALYSEAECRQLTDRARSGAIDEEVFGAMEGGVRSLIDDYLMAPGSRIDPATLPYATVPERITQIAAALIRYRLYGVNRSAAVIADYEEALAYLKSVAKGDIVPGGSTAIEAARQAYGESEVVSGDRIFGRDTSFI